MSKKLARMLSGLTIASLIAVAAPVQAQEGGLWAAVVETGSLRCGAADAPPFIMKDPLTEEYSGYFVEMCRELAGALEVQPEFVDTTWDNMIAGLQAGKWDLAMALTATPKRAMSITFSAPVSVTVTNLVYDPSNPKLSNPVSIEDIDKPDISVAVISGTAQDKLITERLANATIVRLPGSDDIRLALLSKRVDMMVDTSAANGMFSAANPNTAIMNPAPALNEAGVSFGLRRETSAADLQVIDIFIADRIATGHIDELIKAATEAAAQK